jgi:hypothetical protein
MIRNSVRLPAAFGRPRADDTVAARYGPGMPKKPPRRNNRDVYVYFDNDMNVHAPADAGSSAYSI